MNRRTFMRGGALGMLGLSFPLAQRERQRSEKDGTIDRIEGDTLVILVPDGREQYTYPANRVDFEPAEGQQVVVTTESGEAVDVELSEEQEEPPEFPGRRP